MTSTSFWAVLAMCRTYSEAAQESYFCLQSMWHAHANAPSDEQAANLNSLYSVAVAFAGSNMTREKLRT